MPIGTPFMRHSPALVVLVLGIVWNPIAEASLGDGVQNFRSEPSPEVKAPPKKVPDPGPAPVGKGGKKG